MRRTVDHALEYLLGFDGRVHHYRDGYFAKFEIRQVQENPERPHGLRYSFTLHGPDGTRLMGFDNAHGVAPAGSRYRARPKAVDHWHRTETDEGRPYVYAGAEKLIDDFFDEVERVLKEHGVPLSVTKVEERGKP